VSAAVNLTGLTAGTYSGTITISATGATSKTLPVSFTVSPPTTTGAVSLTWSANTESDLAGYKVYVGTQSGVYGPPITVGNVTAYQLNNLAMNTTYFVSITAVDTAGNESLHSAEVSKSIF
jgi:fibronectin type 3 domain-containing protein